MPNFGQNRAKLQRLFDDAVNAERDRRMAEGTDVHIDGYGWVALQGRPQDQTSLHALVTTARLMMDIERMDKIDFRDRNNTDHRLRPPQVISLFMQGSAYIQSVHAAGKALKDAHDPFIYLTEDAHWPIPRTAKSKGKRK